MGHTGNKMFKTLYQTSETIYKNVILLCAFYEQSSTPEEKGKVEYSIAQNKTQIMKSFSLKTSHNMYIPVTATTF